MDSINIFGVVGKCITSELFRTKIKDIYKINKRTDIILDIKDYRFIDLNNIYKTLYSNTKDKYIINIGNIIQTIMASNDNKSIVLEQNNESIRSLYKNINKAILNNKFNETNKKYTLANIINNLGIIDNKSDNDNDIINNLLNEIISIEKELVD